MSTKKVLYYFFFVLQLSYKEKRGVTMPKLFDKQSKRCEICLKGIQDRDNRVVYCEKKGVMDLYDSCRSFEYNPLSRIPNKQKDLPTYSDEDFKIN